MADPVKQKKALTAQEETKKQAIAKAIMSEASIGNQAEQIAIGFASQRNSNHATNQVPSASVLALAESIVRGEVVDNSGGATHWYSPRSMPKEGDETKGFDVGGGLEQTTGLSKKNYRPKWASTMTHVAIDGVRDQYFKFYKNEEVRGVDQWG